MFRKSLKLNGEEVAGYNIITLRFVDGDNDLERAFNTEYYNRFHKHMRLCHLYAIIFYCGMSFLDFLLYPELTKTFFIVRLGIVSPIFIIGFILSFNESYMKKIQYIAVFYVVWAGCGFVYMAVVTPGSNLWPHFIGIIICYIFGYTFMRGRFVYACTAGWILLAIYTAVILLVKQPDKAFSISSVFMLGFINILGMLVCYSLELSARRDFILNQLINAEREKVAAINEQLCLTNRRLERMSYRDGLTNIANRRLFDERLQNDCGRCARYDQPLALILMDIDFFKLFNDYYGHQEGDECLKKVAGVIDGSCNRPTDLAARYGGEEFVILLCNNSIESAQFICKKIRKGLEALAIPHEKSPISEHVTLSMGIACTRPNPKFTVNALVAAADKALYDAKANGRNCVVVA